MMKNSRGKVKMQYHCHLYKKDSPLRFIRDRVVIVIVDESDVIARVAGFAGDSQNLIIRFRKDDVPADIIF